MQILKRHAGSLFLGRSNTLSAGQRFHFVAGWLPWCADGLNLFFTTGALLWTSAMLVAPTKVLAPALIFAFPPLLLFFAKIGKILYVTLPTPGRCCAQSSGCAVPSVATMAAARGAMCCVQ